MKVSLALFFAACLISPMQSFAQQAIDYVRILAPENPDHNVNSCIGDSYQSTDSIGTHTVKYSNLCFGELSVVVYVALAKRQMPPVLRGIKNFRTVPARTPFASIDGGVAARTHPMDILACPGNMIPERLAGNQKTFRCRPDGSGKEPPSLATLKLNPSKVNREEPEPIPLLKTAWGPLPRTLEGKVRHLEFGSNTKIAITQKKMSETESRVSIEYPEHGCLGELFDAQPGKNRNNQNSLVFQIKQISGQDKCLMRRGTVYLFKDGSGWFMHYFKGDRQQMAVGGLLNRK